MEMIARNLLVEWLCADDRFDLDDWATRVRNFVEDGPEMINQKAIECLECPIAERLSSEAERWNIACGHNARRIGELEQALKYLIRGYEIVLENGRDRIVSLGGTCDELEVMERGDIHLSQARKVLAQSSF